ncbi:class I SAM-dependent methyltransferase [Candidatus Pelagibacter sp. HIMB1321]|uniref:class I SAM-dependent methyltransferase n=1 Tax=Candidatus Pelagibacter sp. HIMB1321 TaxID=1388755 RepID=UPI000A0802BB|nr:class I SAM-dependent methyltransferase [Candidatus Pelagibacter sp. HIMB1321]SMF79631.1 2-polyprenyl-3-methyl-5-hydroxy-6-metoxy-1,4-benzoquinol methylase [Candidatus Pelagibacter sp. HIMB1321]
MNNKFIVNNFNRLELFDINVANLRSKNFYKSAIQNRNFYYKKYNKFLHTKKIKCHICKSDQSLVFFNFKKYQLRKCKNCEVIFNNLDLKKFSKSDFFKSNKVNSKDFREEMIKTYNYRKKIFGLERFKYIKKKIFPNKKKFKVLDLGCGSGYFISVLKDKKIMNKGIDLDVNRIEFCKSLKLNAQLSELSSEKNNSYDLITMFDAIEHFFDPIKELKTATKKLKSKSYILAFTPNINSLSFELMREDLNLLAVFRHICFFNKESLNYLSRKAGLKIKSIEYFGLDVKDYFQFIEFKKKFKLNKSINHFANLTQAIIDKQKMSNSMRIIFQKL